MGPMSKRSSHYFTFCATDNNSDHDSTDDLHHRRDFAAEVGISQRMVVYYEKECERIPIHLLPLFAEALGASADELLGLKKRKDNGRSPDNRLWRRFSQVEKLPPAQRKPIIQVMDAFLKSEQLKRD